MLKLLLIFLAGGAGSVARYVVGLACPTAAAGQWPVATLVCNIAGCALIGLLGGLSARWGWTDEVRLMLTVGLCGGFTTFSTFSRETLSLLSGGQPWMAALYVGVSLVAGVVAVWGAMWVAR